MRLAVSAFPLDQFVVKFLGLIPSGVYIQHPTLGGQGV